MTNSIFHLFQQHWHGLSLAAFPFSDGTPLSSQWPIPPLHFFDYEIRAAKGSAGTYFYHSHVDLQAATAAGALIVEDTGSSPYPVDGEKIILLQEIWDRTENQLMQDLLAFDYYWVQGPEVFLVNGQGLSNTTSNATSHQPASGENELAELAEMTTIDVEPGKTYRLRFIGAMAASLVMMGFEHHPSMEIIQADGAYTKPHSVSALQMGPGQRYDAIFTSKTCEELGRLGQLDFYLQMENRAQPYHAAGFAVLRYDNTKCRLNNMKRHSLTSFPTAGLPVVLPPVHYGFLDYELEPLIQDNADYESEAFPTANQVTRRVIYRMQEIARGYTFYVLNNITLTDGRTSYPGAHMMPVEPYLVSLYKNRTGYMPDYDAAKANGGLDPRTRTYPARVGEVIEIVLQHYTSDRIDSHGERKPSVSLMHPWHAHGAKFWDAGGGDGTWDPDVVERQLEGTNPIRRDTSLLYSYRMKAKDPGLATGWRVLRLRITQPGVWVVHCHTLPHVIQGLQAVWVHGEADDILKVGRPHVDGYLEYGGDAYGNVSHSPGVVHFGDLDKKPSGFTSKLRMQRPLL